MYFAKCSPDAILSRKMSLSIEGTYQLGRQMKDQESRKRGKEGLRISTGAQWAWLPYSFLCAGNRRQIIRQVIRFTIKYVYDLVQEFHMVSTPRESFSMTLFMHYQ